MKILTCLGLVAPILLISCNRESETHSATNPKAPESVLDEREAQNATEENKDKKVTEAVIGVWRLEYGDGATMEFHADGTVDSFNSIGEKSTESWRRIPGSVYRFKFRFLFGGDGFGVFQSSITVPEPDEYGTWIVRPKATQYEVFSEGQPESDRLPPLTVEGDQLHRPMGDYVDYYVRKSSGESVATQHKDAEQAAPFDGGKPPE